MFERIKYLYDTGRLTEIGVQNAVIRGWISEKQKKEITNAE